MITRNKEIENLALDFYESAPKELFRFPADIDQLIQYLNTLNYCCVFSYQKYSELTAATVEEIIRFCSSETGCIHREGSNYIIMYNDDPSIPKQNQLFTIMHELGHMMLGHLWQSEVSKITPQDLETVQLQNSLNNRLEDEANYFALCILCPMPIAHILRPASMAELRLRFDLSAEASYSAWKYYQNYSRSYHLAYHNHLIRLCHDRYIALDEA